MPLLFLPFFTLCTIYCIIQGTREVRRMASNSVNIHRLQQAINGKGYKVLYSTSQFYSDKQNRPVTVYVLKQAVWDDEAQKNRNIEIFKSTSQIQILLFLRDMWFEINGWEIPTDNEVWNDIKRKMKEKEERAKADT